jgi:transcriptional regulator with XRE-family HTH domain
MTAKTIPYKKVKDELLSDPEVRKEYDALQPAYQLARLRILRGLTQAELAQLVGTKQPSIARLESGANEPSIAFLRKVAEALGYRLTVNLVPADEPEASLKTGT